MRRNWMIRIPRGRGNESDAMSGVLPVDLGVRGDITHLLDMEDAIRLVEAEQGAMTHRQIESRARGLHDLVSQVMPGDMVLAHMRDSRCILICVAEAGISTSRDGWPARRVEVLRKVSESSLPADLANSLASQSAVCQIRHPNATSRIEDLLRNGAAPARVMKDPGSAIGGHDMAELAAAILIADGYACRLSPPGPDGGVDILAGKGLLGFEEALVVQVKSGTITCGTSEIDRLLGVMSAHQAGHGLIVSWGGFTRAAMARSASLWFQVRLWDRDAITEQSGHALPHLKGELRSLAGQLAGERHHDELETA